MEAEIRQERKAYEEEHSSNIVEIYALGHHTCSKRRGEAACDTVKNTAADTRIFLCATAHDMALNAERIYQPWKLFPLHERNPCRPIRLGNTPTGT